MTVQIVIHLLVLACFFHTDCQRELRHIQKSMGFSWPLPVCFNGHVDDCMWATTGGPWQKSVQFWKICKTLRRCVCIIQLCLVDNLRLSDEAHVSMAAELTALIADVLTQGTTVKMCWIFGFVFLIRSQLFLFYFFFPWQLRLEEDFSWVYADPNTRETLFLVTTKRGICTCLGFWVAPLDV